MKLKEKRIEKVIRVRITQPGQITQNITLEDCTVNEVYSKILELFPKAIKAAGEKAEILIREMTGRKWGDSKYLTLYGLTPQEIKDTFIDYLNCK